MNPFLLHFSCKYIYVYTWVSYFALLLADGFSSVIRKEIEETRHSPKPRPFHHTRIKTFFFFYQRACMNKQQKKKDVLVDFVCMLMRASLCNAEQFPSLRYLYGF